MATNEFKKSTLSIIFCTDVAARGIDVPNITHVIQFDPPADLNDYAHRVGRTARIGKEGETVMFLLPSEIGIVDLLIQMKAGDMNEISSDLALQWLIKERDNDPEGNGLKGCIHFERTMTTRTGESIKKRKSVEDIATDLHMRLERFVMNNENVIL